MTQHHSPRIPTQHTNTPACGKRGRFVDPEQLICPGCADRVRPEPPGYWRVCDGLPAPGFSHPDGSALCRHRNGTVADPIEVSP